VNPADDDEADKDWSLAKVYRFATEAHRKVTRDLDEVRPVVASAALLAFAALPKEAQVHWCAAVRQKQAAGADV